MSELPQHNEANLREAFFTLASPRDVARLLEVKYARLKYHLYKVPADKKYAKFQIPKSSGGFRHILAPVSAIKLIQRKLNCVLQQVYKVKPSVHGFALGRSILTNARPHARKRFVLNVDLLDFFPSINFGRVRGMFMAAPYKRNPDVATVLAQICCFENQLPQGAPTSPVVANMVCGRMDSQLQKLAANYGCFYTRYADDLSFSTDRKPFPEELAKVVGSEAVGFIQEGEELAGVIQANGFSINNDKLRLRAPDRRQEVTGLTTNRFPNVRRSYLMQIRGMLHAWEKFGLKSAEAEFLTRYDSKHRSPFKKHISFKEVVRGKIEFVGMVCGKRNSKYRKLLDTYAALAGITLPPTGLAAVMNALWVIENAEDSEEGPKITQGTAFALSGKGLVTCSHALGARTYVYRMASPNEQHAVTVIKRNEDIDLALIQIDGVDTSQMVGLEISLKPNVQWMDSLIVTGFPNANLGDTGVVIMGRCVGHRMVHGIRRILTDAHIVAGNSGGPVLDEDLKVIGVAVTGADSDINAGNTENHGVIPIGALDSI